MAVRTPPVRILDVLLNETVVGTLTLLPDDQTVFAFDRYYAADKLRPTLSLSFKNAGGGVGPGGRPTQVKVPPFFSNLLPEGHLRDYLAKRARVNYEREFFLLWLLGLDLPGAVVVRPPVGHFPYGVAEPPPDFFRPGALRFSLAGVQMKFSAVMESSGGLTIPAEGMGGSWIVKLPSASFPAVPQNEHVMLELARASGIEAPDSKLVPLDEIEGLPVGLPELGPALAIRRFDRGVNGERIHIEDFAQVFGVFPSAKYKTASYQNIGKVIWSEIGLSGVVAFTKRIAFSVLTGNADMHLKNVSLIYPDGRVPQLAPAYDLVSTVPYIDEATTALSLAGTTRMSLVSIDRFRRFAAKVGVPEEPIVDAVRGLAQSVREAWERHELVAGLPEKIRTGISEHMGSIRLGG